MSVASMCQELQGIAYDLRLLADLREQMAPVDMEMRGEMDRIQAILDRLYLEMGECPDE